MRFTFLSLILTPLLACSLFGQPGPSATPDVRKIEADAANGFTYPYYLVVPKPADAKARPILVAPNNTGSIDDDLAVHDANVKRRIAQGAFAFGKLNVPILMPVFPRPKTDWKIYTHALDRDSMITEKKEFARLDRQLAAMIDDARKRLSGEKIATEKRVLMYGFSAAGMFTNRFAFLHPERVLAAAVGSPGGWPIAPASKYNDKDLRYPIGVRDMKTVSGKKLDLAKLRIVKFLVFLGDKDENDSVVFGDGYDEEDKTLVFEVFGKTPIERWEKSKKLYADARLTAEFKLYPGIAHTITPAMIGDITAFFESAMK